MTTMYRRQQHDRQRNEWSYHDSLLAASRNMKYKRREETVRERRWYAVLVGVLTFVNLCILARVAFIFWKQFNL